MAQEIYLRKKYLNQLISKKHNHLVKVITGIRRCGKSFLLNKLFRKNLLEAGVPSDHIIYMSFDIYENRNYRNPSVFVQWVNEQIQDDGMYYFLLDEVQLLDNFVEVINGLAYKDNYDVYVTGSNAKMLAKDIVTEFGGRGTQIHMYPLSFSEFMEIYPKDKVSGLIEYTTYGGIPMVSFQNSYEEKANMLKYLYEELYVNDIVAREKVRKSSEMVELMCVLASSIGAFTSSTKIQNTFKSNSNSSISDVTIQKYIDGFVDAFLLEGVSRYDIKGRKYIGALSKYYFTDLGLRNTIINYRQPEMTYILENVIYNELKMRGYSIDVGNLSVIENVDGKSGRKNLEVDFVCNKGSQRLYIQSAYSIPDIKKYTQETKSFSHINDNFPKILITMDPISTHYDDNGILWMNIYDFLLSENISNILI